MVESNKNFVKAYLRTVLNKCESKYVLIHQIHCTSPFQTSLSWTLHLFSITSALSVGKQTLLGSCSNDLPKAFNLKTHLPSIWTNICVDFVPCIRTFMFYVVPALMTLQWVHETSFKRRAAAVRFLRCNWSKSCENTLTGKNYSGFWCNVKKYSSCCLYVFMSCTLH